MYPGEISQKFTVKCAYCKSEEEFSVTFDTSEKVTGMSTVCKALLDRNYTYTKIGWMHNICDRQRCREQKGE